MPMLTQSLRPSSNGSAMPSPTLTPSASAGPRVAGYTVEVFYP